MSERLTPERLAELRLIAEAATQGPWDRSEGDTDIYIVGGCDRDVAHIDLLGLANARAQDRDNARHIAAFDPPTVLALLDEIERMQHEVMHLRDFLAESEGLASHLRQRYEALRSAVEGVADLIRGAAEKSRQLHFINRNPYDDGRSVGFGTAVRWLRKALAEHGGDER